MNDDVFVKNSDETEKSVWQTSQRRGEIIVVESAIVHIFRSTYLLMSLIHQPLNLWESATTKTIEKLGILPFLDMFLVTICDEISVRDISNSKKRENNRDTLAVSPPSNLLFSPETSLTFIVVLSTLSCEFSHDTENLPVSLTYYPHISISNDISLP